MASEHLFAISTIVSLSGGVIKKQDKLLKKGKLQDKATYSAVL